MLQSVQPGSRSIDEFRGFARDAMLEQLLDHASALRGARVLHVNATPHGGGVSELLQSVVPLLSDLGIVADWQVISGDDEFFGVTTKIHNGLQGMPVELSNAERELYLETAARIASALSGQSYDFVFILRHGDPVGFVAAQCRSPGPEVRVLLRAMSHAIRRPAGEFRLTIRRQRLTADRLAAGRS